MKTVYLFIVLLAMFFASCNKEHLYVCHSSNVEKDGMVFYSDKAGIKDVEERMGEISCEKIKDEPACWECALYGGKNSSYEALPKLDTCGLSWAEMRTLERSGYKITKGDTLYHTETCRLK